MKRMILSVCALAALLFAVSFAATPASLALDDNTYTVREKCSVCHGLDKICSNLGNDEAWWGSTVARMAGRGAAIEQAQVPVLAAFLANPSADMLKTCGK